MSPSDSTVLDLSHPLESGMQVYPGTDPASIEPTATVEDDGFRTTRIDVDSHTGTHVDAPAHMLTEGPTLDSYPLETFQFSATLADCRPLEAREPIGVTALQAATAVDTRDDIDLLVVRTGWETHWGTDRYLEHPFLTLEAAKWLVDHDVHLALDTLNPDPTPTEHAADDEPVGFPVHHTLFGAQRLILENLRGLDGLPAHFQLQAYPLALTRVDASPVRAVAVLE